jgi:hypothetical protein
MLFFRACPRCEGTVSTSETDDPLCVNCGCRQARIPDDVRAEVGVFQGKKYIGNTLAGTRMGTGLPSASGWERERHHRRRYYAS